MELRIEQQARGTRIIYGEEARRRRRILAEMCDMLEARGFEPIELPGIEPASLYADKIGQEMTGEMYRFPDRKGRELCLRPEGTATVQAIAREHWRGQEKVVYYVTRCYRYERPQAGRYREFIQLGVEWINPQDPEYADAFLFDVAEGLVHMVTRNYLVHRSVKRGLTYYTGEGFEITCPELGAQKQVCGGGPYAEGVGFAIGFDRLMLVK